MTTTLHGCVPAGWMLVRQAEIKHPTAMIGGNPVRGNLIRHDGTGRFALLSYGAIRSIAQRDALRLVQVVKTMSPLERACYSD